MQLESLAEWLEGLRKEDDLLVGELHVPFLQQKESIEVCFVGQKRAVTESQQKTLLGYLRGCSIFCVSQVFINLYAHPAGPQSGWSAETVSGSSSALDATNAQSLLTYLRTEA